MPKTLPKKAVTRPRTPKVEMTERQRDLLVAAADKAKAAAASKASQLSEAKAANADLVRQVRDLKRQLKKKKA